MTLPSERRGHGVGRPSTRWSVVMAALGRAVRRRGCSDGSGTTPGTGPNSTSPSTCWAPTTWSTGSSTTRACPIAPYLPFTYPPLAALAFGPLAVLPRQAGQLVWAAVNVASLYGIIALSLRAVRPAMDRTRLLLWSVRAARAGLPSSTRSG